MQRPGLFRKAILFTNFALISIGNYYGLKLRPRDAAPQAPAAPAAPRRALGGFAEPRGLAKKGTVAATFLAGKIGLLQQLWTREPVSQFWAEASKSPMKNGLF